ncbi:flavodoxin FldB [Pseudidiomarina taiwanensis]|uniref:Flavodoxin n=1 Tax=Pseudidiomarina taiwanensis TaxID=337250 RepID=A0A432ZJY5_9GAMM|nr:flavodoxin FldB [Pseudidiomarina taiwanensis]RUO78278.1 flavodoxin FldB [Pseudidiomarina taiwanensis]
MSTSETVKIGLFYGSTTCFTEIAAEKIQAQFAPGQVELFNIKDTPLQACEDYAVIIFGLSTWDFGEIQEDWESHWSDIQQLQLNNKIVALFGMGDQVGYTDWFQDALGMLHDELASHPTTRECIRIGFWPNQGYEFNASKALTPDQAYFVGLALDEDSQYQFSEERIETWVTQLKAELAEILD